MKKRLTKKTINLTVTGHGLFPFVLLMDVTCQIYIFKFQKGYSKIIKTFTPILLVPPDNHCHLDLQSPFHIFSP